MASTYPTRGSKEYKDFLKEIQERFGYATEREANEKLMQLAKPLLEPSETPDTQLETLDAQPETAVSVKPQSVSARDDAELRQELKALLNGQRQIFAGMVGLAAGQGEIAEQVGAARHTEKVLSATRKALESSSTLHGASDFVLEQVSEVMMSGLPALPPKADESLDMSEFIEDEDEDDENQGSWWA